MSTFDPDKLTVNYTPPANSMQPIVGRKYTLTHSDITAELFLGIGYVYNVDAIDKKLRDEVKAEWKWNCQHQFHLKGKGYVDGGEFSQDIARTRFTIFQKEINTALKGIIYGDLPFFANYPSLLDSPIFIKFQSRMAKLNFLKP